MSGPMIAGWMIIFGLAGLSLMMLIIGVKLFIKIVRWIES